DQRAVAAVPESGTAVPAKSTVVPESGTAVPASSTAVPESGTAVPIRRRTNFLALRCPFLAPQHHLPHPRLKIDVLDHFLRNQRPRLDFTLSVQEPLG
ncbi:hypothetical protein TorRG33x02_251140, partial [Trema orientale]